VAMDGEQIICIRPEALPPRFGKRTVFVV